MARIRRILHPSDFSKASGAAFAKAVELAKTNRADLVLLHVLAPPLPLMAGDGYVSPQVYEDLDKSARAYASKELASLVAKAKKAGVRANAVLRDGIAHEQIVRAARSRLADMIVIGTHGRTGLAKLFLGSVAGRVVSTAKCPVMTVRGK
jgi:nucleotide-binding universal stress UspA family protein